MTDTLREKIAALPRFDGNGIHNLGALISRYAVLAILDAHTAEQPAPVMPCPCICHTQKGITHVVACCDQPPFDPFAETSAVPQFQSQPAPDAVAEAVTPDEVCRALIRDETGICPRGTWVDDGAADDGDLKVDGYVNVTALANWINARIAKGSRT